MAALLPSAQSRVLLQRVEGEAVWVAGTIEASALAIQTNRRGLLFWDNTSRAEFWGKQHN